MELVKKAFKSWILKTPWSKSEYKFANYFFYGFNSSLKKLDKIRSYFSEDEFGRRQTVIAHLQNLKTSVPM